MANQYFDSELTGEQIEQALNAVSGLISPSNNGKILYVNNGKIAAKSATEFEGTVLEPLSVTANGDYTPPTGTDGFDEVHVAVPSATLTTKSITQNGTYNASSDNADGYSSVTVNVSGGGSAVVQPLSVTQNGTYNPPSGVDGYAPVTVNVSGGSSDCYYQILVYDNSGTSLIETRYERSGSTVTLSFEYSLTIGGPSEGNIIQNVSHNMTIYAGYETTYVQSADGKLGVLVYNDLTVLFFNGYTFPSTIVPYSSIDEIVRSYFQSADSGPMAKAYQSAESTEWYGNVGMYTGMRLLSTNNAIYLAGTVYAVIEVPTQPGTTEQSIGGANVQMSNYVAPSVYRRAHN